MKTRVRVAVVVVFAVMTVGCAKKDTIVGKWQGTLPVGGQTATMTITFNPDGTEVQTVEGGGQKITIAAHYTVKDGTLTHTVDRSFVNGQVTASTVTTASFEYKLDGDKLTLTRKGVSSNFILTRVPGGS